MNKLLGIVMMMILILTSVSACTIDIENFNLELRGTGDYDNSISAEDNDEVDIRIEFNIDNINNEDECANNISARTRIYRWDNDEDKWDLYRTTSTKSQELEEDSYYFTWTNEFTVDDRYERYKIEGYILEGSEELDTDEAYVDVENNSCSAIKLITTDFEIDESKNVTKTFYVENNSNLDFEIEDLDVYFTTTIVENGSVDHDSIVRNNSSENVRVKLEAINLSYDRTATGTFFVSGYLGDNFCSSSEIGREEFEVTVNNTGNSSTNTSSSGDCDEIELKVKDFTINENMTTQEIFYIENNSTKRFEITDVKIIDSGIELEPHYYEKYAFPASLADIILEAKAGNTINNKSYENTIKVQGEFSDGKKCSFNDIEKDFIITVESNDEPIFSNCEGFNIAVPSSIEIENFGNMNMTITNNTNKKATIFFEGIIETSPSQIILPKNTSLARTIAINSNKNGEILLRTEIEGCDIATKTIKIYNKAIGELTNIEINTRTEKDENSNKLIISFNNSSTKTFVGILSVDIDGMIIDDQTIAIPKGESYNEIELGNNQAIGKINFTTEGQKIEKEISETNNFTGLFTLGGNFTIIGGFLLIVIIAIAIIIVLTEPQRKIKESWETKE